ncbi:MAG: tetratricopeptide repeat protein [Saprospiraceae bacterium]|nr:tetratricopeptide repeat protein [Saprospiraceae bacterium]
MNQFLESPYVQNDTLEIIKGLDLRTSIYYEQDNYDQTIDHAQRLFKLSERHQNSKGQISGLSFMALVLSDQSKSQEAIDIYLRVINICHETGDSSRLAATYNNLAGAYLNAREYSKSIEYYELTKSMDLKDNFTWGVFNDYHNIGNVYIWMQDYKEAYHNLQIAYDMQKKIGSIQELIMTAHKLGYVMAKTGQVTQGIQMLEESLDSARKNNYRTYEEQSLKYLSEIYAEQNQATKALQYYKDYKSVSDKIWMDQLAAKTDELQIQYATAEREGKIANLDADNKLKDLKLAQASRIRLGLVLGIILLGIIATLIWRNSIVRKRSNADLRQKNKIIEDNLHEKEILLREIHHRVKNNLQIISSLLSLQSRNVDDSAIKDAMKAGQNRVHSMALIHQNLYQEGDLIGVNTKDYITKLTTSLWHSYNIEEERISLVTDIDPLRLDVDIMIPVGLILNELISNALKYAFVDGKPGSVHISLQAENDNLKLVVKDDGPGFEQLASEKTKKSMGMKLIHAFTQKLRGQLEINSNGGTEVILRIPGRVAA